MAKFNGFGGMHGGNNMQALMKQAQKMQEDALRAQQEIEETDFTASVGGGMVTIVMGGNRRIKNLNIKPQIVDPDDTEMLTDLIIAGVNDALAQIEKAEQEKLPQMPGM